MSGTGREGRSGLGKVQGQSALSDCTEGTGREGRAHDLRFGYGKRHTPYLSQLRIGGLLALLFRLILRHLPNTTNHQSQTLALKCLALSYKYPKRILLTFSLSESSNLPHTANGSRIK